MLIWLKLPAFLKMERKAMLSLIIFRIYEINRATNKLEKLAASHEKN